MSVIHISSALNAQDERRILFEVQSYFQQIWPDKAHITPLNPNIHLTPQGLRAIKFKNEFFRGMAEIIPFNVDISDKTIFKRTLTSMGLKVDPEVWNQINDDDVIELYNSDFLQTAHNFSFMNYCSYHPQDLCAYEWWELFSRDLQITESIAEIGNRIFRGNIKSFIQLESPVHIVREILSKKAYTLEVQQGLIAPVYDSGIVVAALATLRAKHINN